MDWIILQADIKPDPKGDYQGFDDLREVKALAQRKANEGGQSIKIYSRRYWNGYYDYTKFATVKPKRINPEGNVIQLKLSEVIPALGTSHERGYMGAMLGSAAQSLTLARKRAKKERGEIAEVVSDADGRRLFYVIFRRHGASNPLSKHYHGAGRRVMAHMKEEYGPDAKRIFYATENKLGLRNPSRLYRLPFASTWYPEHYENRMYGTPRTLPSGLDAHIIMRATSGKRVLLKTSFEGRDYYGWFDKADISRANPEFDEALIESTPDSFCVERLDLETKECTPVAHDLSANEAETVADALREASNGEEYFNVKPDEGREEEIIEVDNPQTPSDFYQEAFEAGQRWFGPHHSSGVANARVVHYGFAKWFNSFPPGYHPRGVTKARLEKAFREGFVSGKRLSKSNPRSKRNNPEPAPAHAISEASKIYNVFHGSEPSEVTTFETPVFHHDAFAKLGDLTAFTVIGEDGKVRDCQTADPDSAPAGDVISLATSPDGKQLYFIGGDQEMNLSAFGLKGNQASKDFVALGKLKNLTYRTEKQMHSFEVIDYTHQSGENLDASGKRYLSNDPLPLLTYDVRSKLLSVVGGAYFITKRGIEN